MYIPADFADTADAAGKKALPIAALRDKVLLSDWFSYAAILFISLV
ncbi:hypothetical protein [Leeuwenhoekiella palythoae]|nr:hypothetical protein [Leeuwenhoekiella palythoae]